MNFCRHAEVADEVPQYDCSYCCSNYFGTQYCFTKFGEPVDHYGDILIISLYFGSSPSESTATNPSSSGFRDNFRICCCFHDHQLLAHHFQLVPSL